MNIIGKTFKVLTFGESHGSCLGCVIEGMPSGFFLDKKKIQSVLDLRKPGTNKFVSLRKETDKLKILSGIFENRTTGSPIGLIVNNNNKRSVDYKNISDKLRPGHSDYTYFKKYKNRDYRGGGRSSARTTVSIVLAGSICKYILKESYFISFFSYIKDIKKKKQEIKKIIKKGDSLGAKVNVLVSNIPCGLGEPLFKKIESKISEIVTCINAVKAVEFGLGIKSSETYGSKNNDSIYEKGFKSNNSGGILGGICTGQDINIVVYVKPTSSISIKQSTIDIKYKRKKIRIKGRHDPCVGLRILPILESAIAIVIFDLILEYKLNFF
ncbi:chorismate synthase [Candidatus Vidania fulgoroideorum]